MSRNKALTMPDFGRSGRIGDRGGSCVLSRNSWEARSFLRREENEIEFPPKRPKGKKERYLIRVAQLSQTRLKTLVRTAVPSKMSLVFEHSLCTTFPQDLQCLRLKRVTGAAHTGHGALEVYCSNTGAATAPVEDVLARGFFTVFANSSMQPRSAVSQES